MKKNIPRIFNVMSHNNRGKNAFFPKEMLNPTGNEDCEFQDDLIITQFERFTKLNQLDRTLEFNYPQFKRLNERRRPCEIRRQIAEDKGRKRDRASVRFLCEWSMWAQGGYKPPTKSK